MVRLALAFLRLASSARSLGHFTKKLYSNGHSFIFSDPRKTKFNEASFNPANILHPFNDDMLDFSESDEIKPNAASGSDEVLVILLKSCKEFLARLFHFLWSGSLEQDCVPSVYKFAHVFPLHKKES